MSMRVCGLITLLAGLLMPHFTIAQEVDFKVKAGWVYALIPYVKWDGKHPRDANICTLGRDKVHAFLLEIKRQESSPVVVREVTAQSDFAGCHVLYISTSETAQVASVLSKIKDKPVLTVSSIPSFADKGGMVEFIIKSNRVTLRINTTHARNASLVIDGDLLGIAETVS